MSPDFPYREGYLETLSPELPKYKKQWVVLENREFIYYERDKNGTNKVNGCLNFDEYHVELQHITEKNGK